MRRLCLLIWLVMAASTGVADAQMSEVLRKVPPAANAILLVDVPAVHNSPIGREKGWKDAHARDFATVPIKVPPESELVVISSSLNPELNFKRDWELALILTKEAFSPRSIARSEGGYIDSIRSYNAVWSPSDAYIVPLSSSEIAVQTPANRQQIARWLDWTQKNSDPQLSSYLASAASQLDDRTPFVMAIDMRDVVQPHSLRQRLGGLDWVTKSNLEPNVLADIVESIQGVTVKVAMSSVARVSISIDFAVQTSALRPVIKPLLEEALSHFELSLPKVSEMSFQATGKSIVATGPIGDIGLRRLASLLEVPTDKFSSLKDAEPSKEPTADVVAYSSQKYFRSIDVLLNDLESTLNRSRDNHATWFERYAKKIDTLPILHVDEQLLGWGASVSENLRGMALAKRDSGIRSGVRKSSIYGSYEYNYDGYGYYGARSTNSMRSQIGMEEQGRANAARFAGWKGIQDSRAKIRAEMTKKYQVEF